MSAPRPEPSRASATRSPTASSRPTRRTRATPRPRPPAGYPNGNGYQGNGTGAYADRRLRRRPAAPAGTPGATAAQRLRGERERHGGYAAIGTGQAEACREPDAKAVAYPNGCALRQRRPAERERLRRRLALRERPAADLHPTFTPTHPGLPERRRLRARARGYPANGAGYADAAGYPGNSPTATTGTRPVWDGQQTAAYRPARAFTPADQAEPAQRGYWDGDPQAYDPQIGRDPREQRYTQRR